MAKILGKKIFFPIFKPKTWYVWFLHLGFFFWLYSGFLQLIIKLVWMDQFLEKMQIVYE